MSDRARLYAERDIIKQGAYYTAHVEAMTAERLHDKSDIAAELAHRDIQIEELKAALAAHQKVEPSFEDDLREIAQDIRLVLNDANRYWHLRDESNPDVCRYYLASDDEASKFNDPAHVDRQIDTDRANMAARDRARKA